MLHARHPDIHTRVHRHPHKHTHTHRIPVAKWFMDWSATSYEASSNSCRVIMFPLRTNTLENDLNLLTRRAKD